MAKFRKKPVIIDAIVAMRSGEIETLEGLMSYREGDFIITGIRGERYPCRPDIFTDTYDSVDWDAEMLLQTARTKLRDDLKPSPLKEKPDSNDD